jgi:hypothetical protein
MAVGAVALIFDALQDERTADLARMLPELEFALLVPYLGPRVTAEAYSTAASAASL